MNPFYIRGYHGGDYFCDRETESHDIISALSNGRSITMTSLRKMGKTGLIMHVAEQMKAENYQLVYIDIMGTDNLNAFINLFGTAIFKLKQSLSKKIPRLFTSFVKKFRPTINYDALTGMPSLTFSMDSSQKVVDTLDEIFRFLQRISEKIPIVVAIDEFQQISNYPETNVEALLRKNIQFLPNVQFIFSGSNKHMLLNMFWSVKRPFYQSTQLLHLDKIDNKKYMGFISRHFETNRKAISNSSIEHILNLTRGHTYYVQYCFNRIFATGKRKINKDDVDLEFTKILLENESYYFEYRNLITPQQWNLLIALARENGIKEVSTGEFLKAHHLSNTSSVRRGITALLQKELICTIDEKYFVYDAFLAQWLSRKF